MLIVVDRMIQYSKIHIVFKYKYRYRLTMDFCAKIKSLHPLSPILSEVRIIIINDLGRNKGIISDKLMKLIVLLNQTEHVGKVQSTVQQNQSKF